MDVLRGLVVGSLTELLFVAAGGPIPEDVADLSKCRRPHLRGSVVAATVVRHDYPIIGNWLVTPTPAEPDTPSLSS